MKSPIKFNSATERMNYRNTLKAWDNVRNDVVQASDLKTSRLLSFFAVIGLLYFIIILIGGMV